MRDISAKSFVCHFSFLAVKLRIIIAHCLPENFFAIWFFIAVVDINIC
jgi:hypothetical protein